ncbi:MAG: hypothetical protein R3A79_13245 [Nannocystaceae bacterium]
MSPIHSIHANACTQTATTPTAAIVDGLGGLDRGALSGSVKTAYSWRFSRPSVEHRSA